MASVIALIILICVAYVIVQAGATAYEITGMDRSTAQFQALSAFTGTGFTTRASERVVNHPVRRRITGILILLGYAGTAGVVATLVSSIDTRSFGTTLLNLIVLLIAGVALWLVIWRFGALMLGDVIRRFMLSRMGTDTVPHEELLLYKRGFGITRVEIPRGSAVIGCTLRDLNLRASNLQILAVEEEGDVHPIPDPDWMFEGGHHLIVYGEIRNVQTVFGAGSDRKRG